LFQKLMHGGDGRIPPTQVAGWSRDTPSIKNKTPSRAQGFAEGVAQTEALAAYIFRRQIQA
jgi:hypothetical protein